MREVVLELIGPKVADDDTPAHFYGLAFTGLMAASGINNERRSRRMLAVLSKGIERWQYLGGLLLGAMIDAAIYCIAIGAATPVDRDSPILESVPRSERELPS